MRKYILILSILFLYAFHTYGQKKYSLEIKPSTQADKGMVQKVNYKKSYGTIAERKHTLTNILFSLYDDAYLTATYDSLVQDSSHLTAYLHVGAKYEWASLRPGNVDEGILSQIGYREKLFDNKPLYYKKVLNVQQKILNYCENNGFPFASVKLDSIQINKNKLSASLHLTKNKEEKIDSVVIKGTAKIAPVYLYNYLEIKPGDLYNESLVRKISSRIKELPFLAETQPFKVIFIENKVKILLYLKKKQASKFNGIVGLLSDKSTGKITLTGDVSLQLVNPIGRGESVSLNWRRLQAQTQDLKLDMAYPFLLSTPFGVTYGLKLYKKDTTYIQINQNIGVQYLLNGGNYFKVFMQKNKSVLLSTKGLEYQTVLPPYADISTTLYGIGYKTVHLDYRLNPRKGFSIETNVAGGTKRILKNDSINPELYTGLKLNSTQFNGDLDFDWYIPIMARSAIKFRLQAAYLEGESLFQSDLYRIGGLKTLRGFDEESIYASAYSIGTVEYHYLLEQNSYLYTFFDGAYYQNKSIGHDISDTPFGFGAGISFETKAGIFSISYALGKQFSNPIDFRSGKVHFGIVNYF